MKLSVFLTATLLATAGCASHTDSSVSTETAVSAPAPAPANRVARATAAASALKTLAGLVKPEKTLGFHSPSELASAALAEPLPMLMVGLNDLRAYQTGDDPRPLLRDEGTVMYPVTVGGEVRSSVILRKVSGDWKATQFGRSNLASFAHAGRERLASARRVAEAGVSLVEIPTMSARMLEHEENGVPMLTSLLDVPHTDLRAGVTLPAAEVFAKLQPLAAQNDGKAPN
jgi:hypothetical protein